MTRLSTVPPLCRGHLVNQLVKIYDSVHDVGDLGRLHHFLYDRIVLVYAQVILNLRRTNVVLETEYRSVHLELHDGRFGLTGLEVEDAEQVSLKGDRIGGTEAVE